MPLYTFYPTHSNGLAPSFVTTELETDVAAALHTGRVLEEHVSAASVVVYRDNQIVHVGQRLGRERSVSHLPLGAIAD